MNRLSGMAPAALDPPGMTSTAMVAKTLPYNKMELLKPHWD